MICHSRKCIFIHIPKAAGSSVENAIWGDDVSKRSVEQLWMGAVRPGYNKYQSGGLQHLLATQIRTEVGEDLFDSYYKFTFTRNPWSKTVSQYQYLKTRRDIQKMMTLPRWFSFNTYLKKLDKDPGIHVQSLQQHRFIQDESGNNLVDFVGKFESLQHDFHTVAKKINLNDHNLPHTNRSKATKPYQAFYTKKQRDLIASLYRQDIELFGYNF